jgi:hypothetical protein
MKKIDSDVKGQLLSDEAVNATRRVLLGLASVAAIICHAPSALAAATDRLVTVADRVAFVNSLFSRLSDARRVGSLYLSQTPSENNQELLWSGIFGSTSARDRVQCRRVLAELITSDFRSMNLVKLRGWVFARSEARLCALSCLG